MMNTLRILTFQNQPCHWRNSKSVKKRSADTVNDTQSPGLSENINLFQSLRVLQEGETALDPSVQNSTLINSVCLKYSAFSTILGEHFPPFFTSRGLTGKGENVFVFNLYF